MTWSPDGKYLAVADQSSRDAPQAISFISVESGERLDSKIQVPGAFVSYPAFSPDGKYLAFISGSGFLSHDIYVASVTGGKPQAVTAVHSEILGVAWTPDSKELVFASNHQGLGTLWRLSLSGGAPESVPFVSDHALGPTISLHGNRLAFARTVADTNLWKVSLSAGDPAESWDGQFLYYGRDQAIWRRDLRSGIESRVIDAPFGPGGDIRACGKDICSVDRSSGHFIRYDPSTKTKHITSLDLGPDADTDFGIDVSPDGRWLVYSRADSIQSDIMLVENFH